MRQPGAYRGGLLAPDGSHWLIDGERHALNPRLTLEPWAFDLLEAWRLCRDGTFGGLKHLPDAGGLNDQPALLLDAFAVCDAQLAADQPD